MPEQSEARQPIVLASDLGFAEGPIMLSTGEIVVTSISRGNLYKVDPRGGGSLLIELGGGANGAAVDADDVIYVAQNGGRWAANGPAWPPSSVGGIQVVRPPYTSWEWLTREPIAPNDLCFGPDGMLYATDPTRSRNLEDGRIWRIDPTSGATELLASVPFFCNGIAFDADDHLYIASTHEALVYVCDVEGGTITTPRVAIDIKDRWPDGLAFDSRGHLVIGAVDAGGLGVNSTGGQGAIETWSVDGERLDLYIPGPGDHFANICFDGKGGLIVTASDSGEVLLIPDWGDVGLPLHPLRVTR
jgi:gluconolactonase